MKDMKKRISFVKNDSKLCKGNPMYDVYCKYIGDIGTLIYCNLRKNYVFNVTYTRLSQEMIEIVLDKLQFLNVCKSTTKHIDLPKRKQKGLMCKIKGYIKW